MTSFQIDPLKRSDSQLAYCPMCLQKNKYKNGDLAWFPKLQCIAAIGHECADKENRLRANEVHRLNKRENYCEEYLIENLPKVHAVIDRIKTTLEFAKFAQTIFRKMRTDCALAKAAIRENTDAFGRLSILVEIETQQRGIGPIGLSRGFASEVERYDFGKLKGDEIALKSDYSPVKEFDRLIAQFESVNLAKDAESALQLVAAMSTYQDKDKHTKLLTNLFRQLSKQDEKLKSFSMFFRPNNLKKLTEWSSHPLSHSGCQILWTDTQLELTLVIRGYGNNLFLKIPKDFFQFVDTL